MTYALIALNALTVLAAAWAIARHIDFQNRQAELFETERVNWDRQRDKLLDRIQAPQKAPFDLPEPDDRDHYISEREIFQQELEQMEGPTS